MRTFPVTQARRGHPRTIRAKTFSESCKFWAIAHRKRLQHGLCLASLGKSGGTSSQFGGKDSQFVVIHSHIVGKSLTSNRVTC